MKKILQLFIAFVVMLPGFVLGGDIVVNNLSSMTNQCNPQESKTYWYYLTTSVSSNPYDNFYNNAANSYITIHNNVRTGTSVDIWRHGNVISNCSNWNRTSTAVPKGSTVMAIQNQDGCTFNIPSYTKTNTPSAVDAQIHYKIGFVQFNYGSNSITDRLYYKTYGSDYFTCFTSGNQVNNGSSCPTSNITYSQEYFHTGECMNYKLFWCGDGLVNSETGTTYNNRTYTEQCDPNLPSSIPNGYTCNASCQLVQNIPDPYCGDGIINQDWEDCDPGSGNFGNGCNSNCKLMTPSCTLTANPNQGNVPLTTTISGTTNSRWGRITKIYFGDGESYTINNWNPILPVNHTYNTIGTFYLTGVVTNVYNGQIRTGVIRPVAYCSINVITTTPPPTPYCGDGILQSNEQCDPGSNNFGNGCNEDCHLMTPSCTLTVNPTQGNAPLTTTINAAKPSWATYTNLVFGDGQSQSNPTFALTHTYNTVGTFNLTLTVQNNYNGQINGTKPTATCSANVVTTQHGSPIPYLLKQQKTGGMSNFTTNQINVEIGEIITYKVSFGNSGTVGATGKVWDILPPCTNYLTSSIHLPNGVTYNGPITGLVNNGNQYSVQYKDFLLQPGQGGYMLVQAQVRSGGMNGMTSCSNVTSYLNTGYFQLGGTTLQSQVIAVRPQAPQLPHLTINKELITAGDMTAGSTVVYKITLTNDGNATYHNAYILDILPASIQYQTSSIQNITNYQFAEGVTGNNEYFIKYYNFNLNAGRSAVIYLTGVLKQGFNFGETTNCAMTSGAIDCEEFPLTPVPFIQKYQKIGNDPDPDNNGWTTDLLTVELGDFISYRIDFGNVGNTPATGEVKDILPNCVKFITGFLVGAYGVGPTYYPNAYNVREVTFTNIPLAAGQTAHMMVVGKIKQEDGCTGTYTYLNTGAFRFLGTVDWEYSTVEAERPNITDVKIEKTVDNATVSSGDVVTYTITYRNEGPEVLQSYTIVDYWPNDKLQFSGVVSPLTPQPDLSNLSNNMIRREFTTPLQVGYENKRQIIIQGIVR